jgi:integrase
MPVDETSKSSSASPPQQPRKHRAIKGFGFCYLRGQTWWIRYSHHGKDIRESSHKKRPVDAERLLKARWKQIGRGRFIGPMEERLRGNDMLDALKTDYENNGRRSLKTLKGRLKPLRDAFGLDRAVDITEARIEAYKAARLSEKTRRDTNVTPATLNRELAALKRAFKLAVEQKRLSMAPVIRLLAEHNVRQGFVEPGMFEKIVKHLPEPLDDVARFAYMSGWRKREILSLTWSDVDRDGRRVTLRREFSKNREPRVLPLIGVLIDIIEKRWRAREYKRRKEKETRLSVYVFHRVGRPLVDFRKRWEAACEAAGLSGLLFHDLRRSAVRNMDRAGVSQPVAMSITGHKTLSVYQRYRIVNEEDRREALARMQASLTLSPPSNVTTIQEAREARQ